MKRLFKQQNGIARCFYIIPGNRAFKSFIWLLFLSICIGSCRKFVQIAPPTDKVTTASVFADNVTATAAVMNIYTNMRDNSESFYLSQHSGLLADELQNYSSNPVLLAYYDNALSPPQSSSFPWLNAYNYIYQANAVIEGLQKYAGVLPAVKDQLLGEAKFIRAFWFFYLTNCFGDIPLPTSTNYTTNSLLIRSKRSDVYSQIVADLTEAEKLLSSNYVDETDVKTTIERVRPTKWAAASLLARTYLFKEDYTNAEIQSSLVIDSAGLYSLCSNLNDVFKANSTEAIWQLYTPTNGVSNAATIDGQYFILTSAPIASGFFNCTTISNQLLMSFELGDQRKKNWINSYNTSTDTFYFPFKYQVYQQLPPTAPAIPPPPAEYTMVLRLAEQFLTRAEARAQQGKLIGSNSAISDLNMIRERAGLGDYSGAADKESELAAILHERQVELFTEWGHRWFDLIHAGKVNEIMNVWAPQKGGEWHDYDQFYPIPLGEIIKDHNLTQNAGY